MSNASGPSVRRVLVIDDDQDVALWVAHALRMCGCVVDTADGGAEGLQKARALKPDVVVCDLAMPDVDGRAVASALRKDPTLAGTRLVAFTGNRDFTLAAARAAGFDDLLLKPGGLATIVALLARSAA